MEVLGQINLDQSGFYHRKLDNDLFIIDQHASDEKFNFEGQQRKTTIKSQRLIVPQKLEPTAANEAILWTTWKYLKRTDLIFETDHKVEAMKKVILVSFSMSKNWRFGF